MKTKFKQGLFKPKNKSKYVGNVDHIVYRSSWELDVFNFLDLNSNVTKWNSEGIIIPYYMDRKKHKYYVDLLVEINEKVYLIEIKPYKETVPPKGDNIRELLTFKKNTLKWNAAREYCKERNIEFLILTEKDIYKK